MLVMLITVLIMLITVLIMLIHMLSMLIPRPFGARNEFTPWDCRRPKVHRELRSNEPG